jgi:hypothetical protein
VALVETGHAHADAPARAAVLVPVPQGTPAVAAPVTSAARPAPTRGAVMAAFQSATRAVAAAPAIAAPVPFVAPMPPPLAIASIAPTAPAAPLARFTSGPAQAPTGQRAEAQASPDLDALADYVLERLRGELRDGRERLGFLLDDSY